MTTKKSRFQGLFEPDAPPIEPTEQEQVETTAAQPTSEVIKEPRNQGTKNRRNQGTKKSRIEEIKEPRNQGNIPTSVPRIKTNYEIRQDYVRALKRVAVDDGRKIYEVMEEAIAQYLEQREKSTMRVGE